MGKILIVDDSSTARAQVAKILAGIGREFIEAEDGSQGLALLQQHAEIDLVIVDYNMPVMNGIEMVKSLREVEGYKELPCIMLTSVGAEREDLIAIAKKVGILAWVSKPITKEQLQLIIAKFQTS